MYALITRLYTLSPSTTARLAHLSLSRPKSLFGMKGAQQSTSASNASRGATLSPSLARQARRNRCRFQPQIPFLAHQMPTSFSQSRIQSIVLPPPQRDRRVKRRAAPALYSWLVQSLDMSKKKRNYSTSVFFFLSQQRKSPHRGESPPFSRSAIRALLFFHPAMDRPMMHVSPVLYFVAAFVVVVFGHSVLIWIWKAGGGDFSFAISWKTAFFSPQENQKSLRCDSMRVCINTCTEPVFCQSFDRCLRCGSQKQGCPLFMCVWFFFPASLITLHSFYSSFFARCSRCNRGHCWGRRAESWGEIFISLQCKCGETTCRGGFSVLMIHRCVCAFCRKRDVHCFFYTFFLSFSLNPFLVQVASRWQRSGALSDAAKRCMGRLLNFPCRFVLASPHPRHGGIAMARASYQLSQSRIWSFWRRVIFPPRPRSPLFSIQ